MGRILVKRNTRPSSFQVFQFGNLTAFSGLQGLGAGTEPPNRFGIPGRAAIGSWGSDVFMVVF